MILVTGSTGLVGARLVYDLAKQGLKIRALKRKTSSLNLINSWFENEPGLLNNIEWFDGDLLDIFTLEEALNNINVVYHCGALVSFDPKHAQEMEDTNIEGTSNLVNLCLENKSIEYFCHVSSVSTLGRISGNHLIDEHSEWIPGAENSNYGISKFGAEREVWRGIAEGLPAVIINPTIILGAGNSTKGSTEIFHRIKKGFNFYTDGESGFVDVRDVSAAMIFLSQKKIIAERYILNSENISFKKLFDLIAKYLNVKPPSFFVKRWISEIIWRLEYLRSGITSKTPFITRETAFSAHQKRRYSADKIRVLGFNFRPLEETIKDTCKALLKS